MTGMAEIPELAGFARSVTASIPQRRRRREAAAELYEHAVSRYEEAVASGADHAGAVRQALAQLGDPAGYARDLERAQRPRVTWRAAAGIVLATLAFLGLLWLVAYLLVNQL